MNVIDVLQLCLLSIPKWEFTLVHSGTYMYLCSLKYTIDQEIKYFVCLFLTIK